MGTAWGSDATWGASTPWGGPFSSTPGASGSPPWALVPPRPQARGSSAPRGSAVRGLVDLDPYLSIASGPETLLQDLVHAITTDTGSLFYDGNWGIDIRRNLNAASTPNGRVLLQQQIQNQWTDDERVQSAAASLDWNEADGSLMVTGAIAPAIGQPFQFVVAIAQASVQLLSTGSA